MSKTHGFQNLLVWQKTHNLVLEIYKVTNQFPSEEKYGLTSQLRRSSSSIVTNIVEGYARKGKVEYLRYLTIANGSLEETKYHLLLARDLNYLSDLKFSGLLMLCEEIGRMICGFKNKIQKS